jgi:predicted aminopeptidase
MQPDGDATPNMAEVQGLIASARASLDKIEACVAEIDGLAMQRAALKQAAWGGK